MAFYENQSDMFRQRAENCKKNGDRLQAQAVSARERGNEEKYREYTDRSQAQYQMQKENEDKAKQHEGKTWR